MPNYGVSIICKKHTIATWPQSRCVYSMPTAYHCYQSPTMVYPQYANSIQRLPGPNYSVFLVCQQHTIATSPQLRYFQFANSILRLSSPNWGTSTVFQTAYRCCPGPEIKCVHRMKQDTDLSGPYYGVFKLCNQHSNTFRLSLKVCPWYADATPSSPSIRCVYAMQPANLCYRPY